MHCVPINIACCCLFSDHYRNKPSRDNTPSARQHHLEALHRSQALDAISRTKAGEPGHSILQSDVPDWEEIDCEPSKRRKYYSPAAFLSCFLLLRSWPAEERKAAWSSWFCQYLGVPIPKLQQASSPQLVCPCNKSTVITSSPARSTRAAGRTHTRPF